jgi:hypothetical protein
LVGNVALQHIHLLIVHRTDLLCTELAYAWGPAPKSPSGTPAARTTARTTARSTGRLFAFFSQVALLLVRAQPAAPVPKIRNLRFLQNLPVQDHPALPCDRQA